jgi:hypothetical protein
VSHASSRAGRVSLVFARSRSPVGTLGPRGLRFCLFCGGRRLMGNVCYAFWPIAKRHMAHAADAQAQELSALTLQNNVEDPAGTLTSLPPDLLQKLLGFLTVDDVHEKKKPVSKLVRSAARFVLTRGRWKPVKFVAEHGEQLMWAAGSAAQDRGALTPAQRDSANFIHLGPLRVRGGPFPRTRRAVSRRSGAHCTGLRTSASLRLR